MLSALADLAPSAEQRAAGLTVPTEWFQWLPASAVRLFSPLTDDTAARRVDVDRRFGERLAAVDQIRPGQRSLRVGWLFVAGRTATTDGPGPPRRRRVFHPLVTVPVRVDRAIVGDAGLVPAGDVELTPLVEEPVARQDLESHIQLGGGALDGLGDSAVPEPLLGRLDRLTRFARSAAAAAGLDATRVIPAVAAPDALMRDDGLVIVAGAAVYAIHETGDSSRAGSLRAWAAQRPDRGGPTAFGALYLPPPLVDEGTLGGGDAGTGVESPYLLTPVQREAVRCSRRDPVTLIAGAPGTGKSHTIAAIACDALARDRTVLLAAKSDATVDALLDLLERAPGPVPVVFGSNERREALAARLSAGRVRATADQLLESAAARMSRLIAARDTLRSDITDQLRAEVLATAPPGEVEEARVVAPALFDPATDLGVAGRLLDAASAGGGWWARRRARRARRALDRLSGTAPDLDTDRLRSTLELARAVRAGLDLAARGGLQVGGDLDRLRRDDDEVRDAVARWLAADSQSARRLTWGGRAAVAALATALRSGRSARREQLKRLGHEDLTRALPLWVGTLGDVDDLLPQVPGLFDLVVVDEASSVDQPLAAPALLRGRRAVIAGDPQQLRHVCFLSDDHVQAVLATHGLDRAAAVASRLDVRRNSAFDVAAAVAPVLTLDEHFRSFPHLVDFVARRLYGGVVSVATRSPRTDSVDCVEVVRIQGRRDAEGVVRTEVERVLAELKELHRRGERSVGVVTPFRAQADALERASLAAFSADDLAALDLRIGTVHAFQGNERDVVLASIGLGPDDGPGAWRFVEDPHLFAVFVTRARRRMILVRSADPPPGGLAEAYLAQADSPPGRPTPAGAVSPWAAEVSRDLTAAGVPATTAYPAGRHLVDVCLDDRLRSVGLECDVHPAGPDAHIERHLALRRSGWDLVDAYRSRWKGRCAELVVTLAAHGVRATQASPPPAGPPAG